MTAAQVSAVTPATCPATGKRRHGGYVSALRHIRGLRKRRLLRPDECRCKLRPYRCDSCGGYHVGHGAS